jgi:myosin-crossreactive antigen
MTLSESFLTFLKNAPRIKIGVEDVSKIPTSNYKKELKYLESKIDQVESENMFLKNQIAINLKMMDSMKTRIVGADEKQNSWNCWKAVVHDMSTEPSPGITLKKLAKHENVQSLSVTKTGLLINNMGCISVIEFGLFIHNKFGETFHLILIEVPSYGLVFHAFKLEESISFYFD